MAKNNKTSTIEQSNYDFNRKCELKKTYFRNYYTNSARSKYASDQKRYPEKTAYEKYHKNLVSGLEKAERKYQSRLKSEQLKQDRVQESSKKQTAVFPKRETTPTLQDYEKISDSVASIFCRTRKMNGQGIVLCTTCSCSGYFWDGKTIGAGHFIDRACRPIRRNEDNIRPQCFHNCNDKNTGNGKRTEMRYSLVKEIGEGMVCRLESIEMLDKQKVGSVLVYPKIPRHIQFIANHLEEIEKTCEEKGMLDKLCEMSAYKTAKRFAEKWC